MPVAPAPVPFKPAVSRDNTLAVVNRTAEPTPLPLATLADSSYEENLDWCALAVEIYTGKPGNLADYRALYENKDSFCRKKIWETTQILYGLRALGKLDGDSIGCGIACGVEPALYYLTHHTEHLFASDLYGFGWAGAQLDMLMHPAKYAPYPYPQDRLTLLQMDAIHPLFPDASMDFVYSISSIEHFGDLQAILKHVRESARILKPGGVLAFSTEFILRNVSQIRFAGTSFFTRPTLEWLIVNSGLECVAPLNLNPEPELLERPATIQLPEWTILPEEKDRLSSLLMDMIFTDVTVFLRKPLT